MESTIFSGSSYRSYVPDSKEMSLSLFELEKMKSQWFRKTELFIHGYLLARSSFEPRYAQLRGLCYLSNWPLKDLSW